MRKAGATSFSLRKAARSLRTEVGAERRLALSGRQTFLVAALAACVALLLTDSSSGAPSPPLPPPSALTPSMDNVVTETADPPSGSPSCSSALPERASLGEYLSCPDLLEANASTWARAPEPTPLAAPAPAPARAGGSALCGRTRGRTGFWKGMSASRSTAVRVADVGSS